MDKITEMITKGTTLYPNSMQIYELAIRYYLQSKSYENITKIFSFAINNNEKCAIELYRFVCSLYLHNPSDKEKARSLMLEAINSSNKKLSANFQPYVLEYYGLTEGIEKAREVYSSLLNSKTSVFLTLEFFTTMIRLEQTHTEPDHTIIKNCFERSLNESFGRDNPEVITFFLISAKVIIFMY
jgi:tetratricopeptide (TPR) repeat protein